VIDFVGGLVKFLNKKPHADDVAFYG